MIDGEIYILEERPLCVFIYCDKGKYSTSFYAGVTSYDAVVVSTPDKMMAMSRNAKAKPANGFQVRRLMSKLAKQEYYWSSANKCIIHDDKIIKL